MICFKHLVKYVQTLRLSGGALLHRGAWQHVHLGACHLKSQVAKLDQFFFGEVSEKPPGILFKGTNGELKINEKSHLLNLSVCSKLLKTPTGLGAGLGDFGFGL